MLKVTQPGSSRSRRLSTCLGGMVVASKMWTLWLCASTSQSSLSSGVSPTITPLRTMFSRAVNSGLKPTPSSMKGASRPAILIVPESAR